MPGLELSFKVFFHDNIYNDVYGNNVYFEKIGQDYRGKVSKKFIEEHTEDIEKFVITLEKENIQVKRPKILNEVTTFKTPYWEAACVPALNIRDQAIIIGNEILETSPQIRSRYFENDLLKPIFLEYFKKGSNWTSSPKAMMLDSSFDLSYIISKGDINPDHYKKKETEYDYGYEIMFDGAQCLRFGKDIIMNVSTENHLLGFKWLANHFKHYHFHSISMADNHIDSTFIPLRPGVLLVNPMKFKIEQLPASLQKWDIINAPEPDSTNNPYKNLSSKFIDINVLSLDENKVVISDTYKSLIKLLEQKGFTPIPIKLRHKQLFAGGFHCITLDTIREDKYETFF